MTLIRFDSDVFQACCSVRKACASQGLDRVLTEQLVLAVSEVARNQIVHARKGWVRVLEICQDGRFGVSVEAVDEGEGIADVEEALSGTVVSKQGLGFGLASARNLVHQFELESAPGKGTTIRLIQWARPPAS